MTYCFRKSLFVASLLSVACGAAFAAPPSLWTGVVKSETGKSTRVVATIDGDKVSLRFREPANCTIVAGLLDVVDEKTIYRFSVPTNGGGFCARLYPGDLSIARVADDSVDVAFDRQKSPWAGVLYRAIDP